MGTVTILKVKDKDRALFANIVKSNNLHFSMEKRSGILSGIKQLTNMRLAIINSRVVGCSCSSSTYTCMVYVLPYFRKRGIGKKLIQGMDVSKVDNRKHLKELWKYGKNSGPAENKRFSGHNNWSLS